MDSKRRKLLSDLLYELAKSQAAFRNRKNRREIFLRLEEIYCDVNIKYRHYYSEIFAILSQIDLNPEFGSLEILAQNMEQIKRRYQSINKTSQNSEECIDIQKEINKLSDHVNLDISRIRYMKKIEAQIIKSRYDLTQLLKDTDELQDDVENAKNNAQKMQKEYITILGIFSAIIISFTGGIAFSSSVLENIANASIYRTLTVVVLIGFIFLNMVYILIQFIMSINNKEYIDTRHKIYITHINIILGIALVLIVLAWIFDFKSFADIIRKNLYKY